MPRNSVVIVGAGISGLSAAWELSGGASGPDEKTPRIEVIEASDRFGGLTGTREFAGRTVDLGADGFLGRRPEVVTLVRELGMEDQLEAINASGASLFLRGRAHELPTGLVLGVPTSTKSLRRLRGLSWHARMAARRDYYLPKKFKVDGDVTIGAIVRAKLGAELALQVIEPMIGGIQAGRIDELSAKSVFPGLVAAAKSGGSLMRAMAKLGAAQPGPSGEAPASQGPMFYSLDAGVGSLADALAEQLERRGVVLRRATRVTALRRSIDEHYPWEVDTATTTTRANGLIMATPAGVSGQLLGSHDARLQALSQIDSAGAAMVCFRVPRDQANLPNHGTGVLVPLATPWHDGETMMITAVTFLDRKWPRLERDGDCLLRAHVGRIDDDRWEAMSDTDLTTRVSKELATLFGSWPLASDSFVSRWPDGLPQYRVGHEELVRSAKDAAAALRVALAGNAYDGVGIPASVGSGRDAARQVQTLLGS